MTTVKTPLRIGDMRTSVVIEKLTGAPDSAGQKKDWSPVVQLYASIEPLTGREQIIGRSLVSKINVRVRTRYVSGIAPAMRIRFEGRTLGIDSVIDVENKHVQLELLCIEVE